MNDVLARAACDFKDYARSRQDIAKNIENEIAVTHCRRRVLPVIGHLPRTFYSASASFIPSASLSFTKSRICQLRRFLEIPSHPLTCPPPCPLLCPLSELQDLRDVR